MLVVKIELWPNGNRHEAKLIGSIVIENDGSGTAEKGNYAVGLSHAGKYAGKKGL